MAYVGAEQWRRYRSLLSQELSSAEPGRRRVLAIDEMLNPDPSPSLFRDDYRRLRETDQSTMNNQTAYSRQPPSRFELPWQSDPHGQGPSYPPSPHRRGPPPIIPPPHPMSHRNWSGENNMSHLAASFEPLPRGMYLHRAAPTAQPSQPQSTETDASFGAGYREKVCVLCLEKFAGNDPKSKFPHQCKKCSGGDFCATCLKDWFIDSCRNEGKMPPKCCSLVPLAAVKNLLDNSQIELYKAKYEEWSTTDRLYCPVPTCSAFIPQRLYSILRPGDPTYPRGVQSSHIFSYTQKTPPKKEFMPQVGCPTCDVSICTKCRSFSHIGICTENDIDPGLEEQLKKWKIKRCPKCRAGVRKMYGCAHVECRCGAHFCWECLLPIAQCGGNCDDSDPEDDPADYEAEEDDLDGRARFYEGAGPNFGPEPSYSHAINIWGCDHIWTPLISSSIISGRPLECNRCFRVVTPSTREKQHVPGDEDEDTEMSGMIPPWPRNISGQLAWQCFSGHMTCMYCPKEPPAYKQGDASWLFSCDCQRTCFLCDKNEAMAKFAMDEQFAREQKEKEDSTAFECRCGMIVCGPCKVGHEHT